MTPEPANPTLDYAPPRVEWAILGNRAAVVCLFVFLVLDGLACVLPLLVASLMFGSPVAVCVFCGAVAAFSCVAWALRRRPAGKRLGLFLLAGGLASDVVLVSVWLNLGTDFPGVDWNYIPRLVVGWATLWTTWQALAAASLVPGEAAGAVRMITPDPVPAPSTPVMREGSPVLPYESRGARRGGAWRTTVYEVALLSAFAAAAAPIVFLCWSQYRGSVPSTPSRQPTVITTVQSLRSQLALFKIQHNDRIPGRCPLVESGGPFDADEATFWAQMTQFTDVDGYTSPTKTPRFCYGPHFRSVTFNPLNGSKTIASAPARGVGFVYDFAGGAGSGKVWGVDQSGALVRQ
jgi:hypothetical protein